MGEGGSHGITKEKLCEEHFIWKNW